jgi:hypothetical protein
MIRARLSRPIYILARFAEMLIAAWLQEVDAARKTLERAGATPSQPGAA